MDYRFLSGLDLSETEMMKSLMLQSEKICERMEEYHKNGKKWILTESYSVSLSSDPRSLRWASEDYEMEFHQDVFFTTCHDQDEKYSYDPEIAMLTVIGGIMRLSGDDCLVLGNGEKPIVMRRNGRTIVDDSRWGKRAVFPYEALGVDFDWGVIPYD